MSNITCTPTQAVMVRIGKSKKLYASKKTARRNVAWRILYDTGRIIRDVEDVFGDKIECNKVGWVWKHYECDCTEAQHPYGGTISGTVDSNGCLIHNRYNGYYKRLHERVMRWLAAGYMAKDSGLQEDLK